MLFYFFKNFLLCHVFIGLKLFTPIPHKNVLKSTFYIMADTFSDLKISVCKLDTSFCKIESSSSQSCRVYLRNIVGFSLSSTRAFAASPTRMTFENDGLLIRNQYFITSSLAI